MKFFIAYKVSQPNICVVCYGVLKYGFMVTVCVDPHMFMVLACVHYNYNYNALCSYPLVKMEIGDSSQISTTAPIFSQYDYFRQTIWRLASVQFHF